MALTHLEAEGRHPLIWVHVLSTPMNYESLGSVKPLTGGGLSWLAMQLIHSREWDYLAPSADALVAAQCIAIWLTLHKECRLVVTAINDLGLAAHSIKKATIITEIERARDEYEAKKKRQ